MPKFLLGCVLIIFGYVYFYFVTNTLFPMITNDTGRLNSFAFSWLGSNIFEMILFIFTNPLDIIEELFFSFVKLKYILVLFGALGFISLLYPRPLLVAIPILFISLISKNSSHYGLANHYTAGLIAPIMYSFIHGLPRAKQIFSKINIITYGHLLVVIKMLKY